ncbi:TlpA family protein disulfide reductase [Fodinibius halophilus]|uniref:TlpA family protein disulfide reductase n=1 Tax=Fodinibius halophilus TaxID=1736908 RepID=A0A6M1SVQ5_9BACT|nr:TlpA disulfide reductase family protein [Fodinibius halophilus]NGP87666.1 TlpA family protein disulfide reductase [Fodinibius halophilus]
MTSTEKNKTSGWKRSLIEWSVIGVVIALLYFTGWHTEVLGTLQRGMLWTGLFDADTSQVTTTDGPVLTSQDYQFELLQTNGSRTNLSNFKGDVIFLNVWASWCPPCVAEMPTIETLYNEVSDNKNIRFILLSMDQEPQKAVQFMQGKEFDMPYYFPASKLPAEFQSQYLPTTYVISKEGKIIYKKEGIADYSATVFMQWIEEMAER